MKSLMGVDLKGKRVRITPRPVEFQCENCGHIVGSQNVGESIEGIVMFSAEGMEGECPKCEHIQTFIEGWWKVRKLNGVSIGFVPYTLMEVVE